MDCSTVSHAAQAAGTTICLLSPADWHAYIASAIVVCSAVASGLIALKAIRTTRAVARQRATLDLIEKRESSEHYRLAAAGFSRIRRADGFGELNNPQTDAQKADRKIVVDFLNHYELISIGILNDILDEKIYATWMRGPFTRDWGEAAGWIQRERWKRDATSGSWRYYDRIFANYQTLATRWSPDAIVLSQTSTNPPPDEEAGGPGDEALPAARDGSDGAAQ